MNKTDNNQHTDNFTETKQFYGADKHPGLELLPPLNEVLQKALKLVGGQRGSIVLVDPQHEDLVILVKVDPDDPIWPPPPDRDVRLKFSVGQGIAGHVAKTGKPHNATIASQDPNFVAPTARPADNWSLLAVPIISHLNGRKVLGVISVEGPENQPDYFGEEAVGAISSVAAEAVEVIERAMWSALLHATLSYYRLRRILAVSQVLVSQRSLDQVLEQMALIAFEELQADLLTLYRWDEERQSFITPPIKEGKFNAPEAMDDQIHQGDVVEKVFTEWGSQFFENAQSDRKLLSLGRVPPRHGKAGRERFSIRERVKSAAILRLEVGNKHVGVLCVNWRKNHAFDETERNILGIFANHVAAAIEKDRLMRVEVGRAVTAQRERLHRDLHDWIGGNLSAISQQSAACNNYLQKGDIEAARKASREIDERATEAIKGVGALLADLKSVQVADLRMALKNLRSELSEPECTININIDGPVSQVGEGVSEIVLRIAREAIINAQRHGRASHIDVSLTVTRELLDLVVADNGVGGQLLSEPERREKGELGLSIMEQLALVLGGQLIIDTNSESGGWQVVLHTHHPFINTPSTANRLRRLRS